MNTPETKVATDERTSILELRRKMKGRDFYKILPEKTENCCPETKKIVETSLGHITFFGNNL